MSSSDPGTRLSNFDYFPDTESLASIISMDLVRAFMAYTANVFMVNFLDFDYVINPTIVLL